MSQNSAKPASSMPTTSIIVNGFLAGIIAGVISFLIWKFGLSHTNRQAVTTALFFVGGTAMVTIIAQVVIYLMRSPRP